MPELTERKQHDNDREHTMQVQTSGKYQFSSSSKGREPIGMRNVNNALKGLKDTNIIVTY